MWSRTGALLDSVGNLPPYCCLHFVGNNYCKQCSSLHQALQNKQKKASKIGMKMWAWRPILHKTVMLVDQTCKRCIFKQKPILPFTVTGITVNTNFAGKASLRRIFISLNISSSISLKHSKSNLGGFIPTKLQPQCFQWLSGRQFHTKESILCNTDDYIYVWQFYGYLIL